MSSPRLHLPTLKSRSQAFSLIRPTAGSPYPRQPSAPPADVVPVRSQEANHVVLSSQDDRRVPETLRGRARRPRGRAIPTAAQAGRCAVATIAKVEAPAVSGPAIGCDGDFEEMAGEPGCRCNRGVRHRQNFDCTRKRLRRSRGTKLHRDRDGASAVGDEVGAGMLPDRTRRSGVCHRRRAKRRGVQWSHWRQ